MTEPKEGGDDLSRADEETRVDMPVSSDGEAATYRQPLFPSVGGTPSAHVVPDSPPAFERVRSDPPLLPAFGSSDGQGGPVLAAPVGGRSGRWRWAAAALATILVFALVGGALVFLAPRAGTPSLVAGYAPASSALYTELRLDLPGDQHDRLVSFMSRFPGFADPQSFDQKIDDTLQQAFLSSGTGLDWKNDIDPWFGGQVGVFASTIVPAIGTPPSMTFAFSVKDRQKLDAVVAAKLAGGGMDQEDYKGQVIWTGNASAADRRISVAVTNEAFLVSTRNEDIKSALDVKAGEQAGLAADPFFVQQLGALHSDRLALVYYDYSSILDSIPTAIAGLPPGCLEDARNAARIKLLGEVRAETDHLAFTARSQIPTGANIPPAAGNKRSTLIEQMPAGALAYVEFRQVGMQIKAGVEQVLDCAATALGGFDPRAVETFLGVSLADYFDFIDDAAMAVTFANGKVGGGLIATVDDTAVATARVERLLGALRGLAVLGGGVTVEEKQHGDVTMTVITFGGDLVISGPVPAVSIAVANGRLYIGLDDFVANAIDRTAQDSLSTSPRLQAALASAGAENAGIIYVDIAGLRAVAESFIPASERARYETEALPFIRPVTHLIVVNRTDGSISVGNAFLYVE
jgi:hypothetical protein